MTNATTLITPAHCIFVAGIQANNSYPADFLLDNLKIQTNVIEAAWRSGYGACCFWAAAASTPSLLTSRSARKPCSLGP